MKKSGWEYGKVIFSNENIFINIFDKTLIFPIRLNYMTHSLRAIQ